MIEAALGSALLGVTAFAVYFYLECKRLDAELVRANTRWIELRLKQAGLMEEAKR